MTSPKLCCPSCGGLESLVRPDCSVGYRITEDGGFRRVRACVACGARFTSIERVEGLFQKKPAPPERNRNI